MQRFTFIAILTAVLLAVGGFLLWQHLSARIAALDEQIEEMGRQVAAAEGRATAAEQRAEGAEREAAAAARDAEEAITREQRSAEQASQAEAARQQAEEQESLAAQARQQAEARAREEEAARAAAEERRTLAEQRRAEAAAEAEAARDEARRAREETERVKRRLEQQLERLERSLNRIASTRRTALGVVMTLDSSQIEFDFDEAQLRPRNREVLSQIAGVLLTFEDYGLQIFGHTDDVGSVEYNEELSERRARAVRDYMVEAGIAPDVVTIMGMGKSSPLVEGTDPESRQRNRRVELAIVFSEGEYEALRETPTDE
jgi:outer membrane protein OmpA-like peptidoglycan-associated protein